MILFVVLLFSMFLGVTCDVEGFEDGSTGPTPSIELVVARYNESLDWINTNPYNKYPVIVYNKGTNSDFIKPTKLKDVVPVKNVGRCDHTYLYHIIQNYDNLADITVFLPGSIDPSETDPHGKGKEKDEVGKLVISNVEKKGDTYFSIETEDVYQAFKDFELDEWRATYGKNTELNSEFKLTPASPRPFGKWFRAHFGDMKVRKYGYFGIFAVHKKHILQHPKSYYEDLIKELEVSSNPEVGHYFERAWGAVFGPLDGIK